MLEQVRDAVNQQGLHSDVFDAMWKVLKEGESSLSEVWGYIGFTAKWLLVRACQTLE